jgi:hypothetical protein
MLAFLNRIYPFYNLQREKESPAMEVTGFECREIHITVCGAV